MTKKIIFIAQEVNYYKKHFKKLKNEGFEIIKINLTWKYNTFSDWVSFAENQIKNIDIDKDTIISGHSIGASVAFVLSQGRKFKKTLLYSPSPLFVESLSLLNNSALNQLGKRRLNDIKKNFELKKISKNLKNPVNIYIGSDEHKMMKKNVNIIFRNIKNSKLIIIEGKNHANLLD